MVSHSIIFVCLLPFIPCSFCLNVLLVSIGAAGHVIPIFELSKAMKTHNITFITHQLAESYIDLKFYSNSSSFRVVYADNTPDALIVQKKRMDEAIAYFSNHSLVDSLSYTTSVISESIISLLKKTVDILMVERFDVIIASSMVKGIHVLCDTANIPCVIQSTESFLNIFDVNLPNSYSLLSSKQLTKMKYRVYNVAFNFHLIVTAARKFFPVFYTIFQSLPQLPEPFEKSFTLSNLLFSKAKCLELISMPPTFYTPTHPDHYKKYLGPFVDETTNDHMDNDLTRWIKSKSNDSVVYVAFGSVAVLQLDRMQNLINGLAAFLLQISTSSVLLAFRNANYDNYQTALSMMENDDFRRVLMDDQRVKVDNGFLPQKWILKQNSIELFLSHCGMGSSLEALYFEKSILCMPFSTDQFFNAIAIERLGVGLSLFVPPSPLRSLINPDDFHDYTWTASSVTTKLATLWKNISYEKAVRIMSLEMKHAGGLRRAVEEIEFFVHLNGDLDRYAPFHSTLPFYQRYMLDLVMIYIVLPVAIMSYFAVQCCQRSRKTKQD